MPVYLIFLILGGVFLFAWLVLVLIQKKSGSGDISTLKAQLDKAAGESNFEEEGEESRVKAGDGSDIEVEAEEKLEEISKVVEERKGKDMKEGDLEEAEQVRVSEDAGGLEEVKEKESEDETAAGMESWSTVPDASENAAQEESSHEVKEEEQEEEEKEIEPEAEQEPESETSEQKPQQQAQEEPSPKEGELPSEPRGPTENSEPVVEPEE
ncbi:MAG: hypothetical protein U9M98_03430 [Patescibacteria group bacterium]|nr:hypothetical protein [Patescibacteria group bacterium]